MYGAHKPSQCTPPALKVHMSFVLNSWFLYFLCDGIYSSNFSQGSGRGRWRKVCGRVFSAEARGSITSKAEFSTDATETHWKPDKRRRKQLISNPSEFPGLRLQNLRKLRGSPAEAETLIGHPCPTNKHSRLV